MSAPAWASIDAQFVSDYVTMCRHNDETPTPGEIVEAWLDNQDAPETIDDEVMNSLVAQVHYYLH